MNITALFDEALSQHASDIHLATGESPFLRVSGNLNRQDLPPLDFETFTSLMDPVMTPESWARIRTGLPVERPVVYGGLNFSLIAFRTSERGLAATFRIIPNEIPALDKIGEGAQDLMQKIVNTRRGLVLIAGPTGSGKWTTACSIVETINCTKPARIFVVERGANYVFQSKESLVTQLYVGEDFETFERALETLYNADLDVVVINDITNGEVLRQAIIMADTGHLVIGNIHADSVTDVLQRLLESAGPDAVPLRRALAHNLVYITVQRLFSRAIGTGRVPAYEWLANSVAVKQAILAGDLEKVAQLQGSEPESRSLQTALDDLIQLGKITDADAAPYR